jgi:hypothetical protein
MYPIILLIYICLPVNYPHIIILPSIVSIALTIYLYIIQRLVLIWAYTGLIVFFVRNAIEFLGYYVVDENTVEDTMQSRMLHFLSKLLNVYYQYWIGFFSTSFRNLDLGYIIGFIFYGSVAALATECSLNCLIPTLLYSLKDNRFTFNIQSIHHFAEIISRLKVNNPSHLLRIGFLSPAKELLSSNIDDFNDVFDNIESYSLEIVLKKLSEKKTGESNYDKFLFCLIFMEKCSNTHHICIIIMKLFKLWQKAIALNKLKR